MVKAHPLNAPHTAGIFCDMSIDGPVIGTLVIIVDRAKNLPNRKTIGKQDPYCAARLGKEAKKTTTDIRGGQTPRWDQEIRFTVHDSPDYYQLKISVFNDDKKTDLIGETWVDLRDIVVPGGGQNDLWHNLTCKGKYAGEIRIELTYYDTRPKPEKPVVAKPKQLPSETDSAASSLRAPPKRRPLPSDPFTGQAPAQSLPPVPGHNLASSRQHPVPPRDPYATSDQVQTTPHRSQPNPTASHSPDHGPSHSAHYNNSSSLRHRQPDAYSSAPNSAYHTTSNNLDARRASPDGYTTYSEDAMHSPDHQGHTPDKRYMPSAYGAPSNEQMLNQDMENERPPPPPAHRSTHSQVSETRHSPGHEKLLANQTPPAMRMDVLRSEAHRQSGSSSAYPGRPVYRPYDSAPSPQSNDPHIGGSQVSPPRHHSYDTAYDVHHKSMQATVEDVPDSPSSGLDDFRRNGSRAPDFVEPEYRQDPSPAPLSLRGRGSAPPAPYIGSPASASHRLGTAIEHAQSDPSLSSRALAPHAAPQPAYDSQSQVEYAPYRGSGQELENNQVRAPDGSLRFALPSVPASLVPGVDPCLSMEISHRINEDRRHERRYSQLPPGSQPTALAAASVRGRQMAEQPPSYGAPQTRHESYDAYDRSPSERPASQGVDSRGLSPNPSPSGQHTIRRKSISPAAPAEGRRLSGVPFGPDSYDALNPALATTAPKEAIRPDYDEINGKIITHDGKEIDPTDHLPMDTWAPEPEPKGKKPFDSPPSRSGLSGPQPAPPSGRRPLRVREVRPTSMAVPPSAMYNSNEPGRQQLPPPNTGRNRLQKKMNRSSAMPVVMSGANGGGPGPLAPIPQPQDNFTPRPLGRASTYDYENHAPPPMYDTSAVLYQRDYSISAPPIPAKVPLAAGPGALMTMNRGGYGDFGGENALMEEMSRIDIGTGRARRHHQKMGY